ncbi:relaxase/mobilization nuclease domain-containing protein [Pseudomonas sp. CJQ_13]|uniref:relaxase/mobilization nuclease domain-containing protein n=1 Tax=Pseudomonas sp. CJQ_13 TaxID=3367170 RepID=UPI00370BDEF8
MIGKIFRKSSGTFRVRIRYIFGCTKHDHGISGISTIDSNCISRDPLKNILAGSEDSVNELIREFDNVERMRRMSIDSERVVRPVWHAMLSLRPGESLSALEWRTAVRMYLAGLGFDESNLYVAVMHRDKDHEHVHIVANRIRIKGDFALVRDSCERNVSVNTVSDIEDYFSLCKAPKPHESWSASITHAELMASQRDNDLPTRHRMIAKIAGVIEATNNVGGDMFMFVQLLRRQQVYVHLALGDLGQPTGISFEFQGKFISGRALKRSRLTWNKLVTQEGIFYDPDTVFELKSETEVRDFGEQEAIRVYYYEFASPKNRIYIRFTAKQIEVFKMIEEMSKILELFFGGGFKYRERKAGRYFVEYVPGQDMGCYEELFRKNMLGTGELVR